MSRRLPDACGAGDPSDHGGPGDATPEHDPALLTAYVDGVAELSSDERHRVESLLARDPQAQADQAVVGKLLGQLRDLREVPGSSGEPDWTALERSIRQVVGPEIPRPWWRRWSWLAPTTMLAAPVAVLLAMWARPAEISPPDPPPASAPAGATHAPRPAEEIVPLWLDGSEVDVDVSAPDMLADLELGASSDDDPASSGADSGSDEVALLPAADLAWIDKLDEEAIDRAERWLARKKG